MIEIHVSPSTDATGSGTKSDPFSSIQEARDFLRSLKSTSPDALAGGAVVYLEGGTYVLEDGIVFNAEDSGSDGAPVIYRSDPDNPAVLSGARQWKLADFTPVTDPAVLRKIPPGARNSVRVLDLRAEGIMDFGSIPLVGHSMQFLEAQTAYRRGVIAPELFFDGKRMTLARYPNDDFTEVGEVQHRGDIIRAWMDDARGGKVMDHEWIPESERNDPPTGFVFRYGQEKVATWRTATDARLFGYWYYNWSDQSVRVASFDAEEGLIHTVEPSAYGVRPAQRFFIFNLLEELDAPGEWYLDREAGLLYLFPPVHDPHAHVSLSLHSGNLVTIQDAAYISMQSLHVQFTRGQGLQIHDSSGIVVENCVIRNTGKHGVVISGGKGNRITGCEVQRTGASGILLEGGDIATLQPSGHVVEYSHIHHFAEIEKTYNPGISLSGVGHHVRNNELHSAPHFGIFFSGNNHLIERNYIHDVVRDADDSAAIYAGRSWVERGTIIRHNLIRNISGFKAGTHLPSAIYLDDGLSGAVIEGNILLDVAQGIMLNGGREHRVRHNVFIHTKNSIRHTNLREAFQTWAAMSWRTLWERLEVAPVESQAWREAYPRLADLANDEPDLPKYNVIQDNVYFLSPWIFGTKGIHDAVTAFGKVEGNREVTESPGYFDSESARFVFDPSSDAFRIVPALQDIPVDQIGRNANKPSPE